MTLPEGVNISLSAGDGLLGCSEAQIGLGAQTPATCPDASKIGVVEIETQLLSHPLQGAIYLAAQAKNPFDALLAVYVVAEEPFSAVLIKLAGELDPNPVTGQLTLTLRELPQLPISELHLRFFGAANFSIPPGQTREIKLELSATARTRLKARHGRLNGVQLKTVKSSPAPAEMRTTDVGLVREPSRRRRSSAR